MTLFLWLLAAYIVLSTCILWLAPKPELREKREAMPDQAPQLQYHAYKRCTLGHWHARQRDTHCLACGQPLTPIPQDQMDRIIMIANAPEVTLYIGNDLVRWAFARFMSEMEEVEEQEIDYITALEQWRTGRLLALVQPS